MFINVMMLSTRQGARYVDNNGSTAEGIVGMIPDVLQKVKGMFSKKKDADDFSEITQDDIDMV